MSEQDLSASLGIVAGAVVSIVGAGGKTTTMYRLCHELVARGLTVVSTTTTSIQRPTPAQSEVLLIEKEVPDLLAAVQQATKARGHVTVARSWRRADKLEGLRADRAASLLAAADVVVIEADGARHCRIKAPAAHEPVVPAETTCFLSVAGLHALGWPLEQVCHRVEIAAQVAAQPSGSIVTAETLVRLLGAPDGGLKGRPLGAGAWALLTHLTPENEAEARAVAAGLESSSYTGIFAISRSELVRLS